MRHLLFSLFAQQARIRTLSAYRNGDWRKIPIQENQEPLVQVPADFCHSFYCIEMKLSDDERIFLRKTVLQKFLVAREIAIILGYDMKVLDGWRPISLQKALFWYYLKEFTAQKFGVSDTFKECSIEEVERRFFTLPETLQETLKEANRVFVSWPSSSLSSPSPHATGGSIDVWLYKDGKPVNLGVPFDWMEEDAGAFFHLKFRRKRFHGNDREISRRRNILLYTMTQSGFSCYGPEIWHFNYGNQMHALVVGGGVAMGIPSPNSVLQEEYVIQKLAPLFFY